MNHDVNLVNRKEHHDLMNHKEHKGNTRFVFFVTFVVPKVTVVVPKIGRR